MIHVCFGLHDKTGRYSKFTGTAMLSAFDNTSADVTVHILHDDTLTQDNREKFIYVAGRCNQRVKFYNVDELFPQEIISLNAKLTDKINSRFSIGAFYRLLTKKIFAAQGIGKVIYLDSDIVVNLDLDELWRKDVKNFALAAVPELDATRNHLLKNKFLLTVGRVRPENYFCSGVLLLNVDALAENFFYDGVQFLVDNPACESVDQDILNAFFATDYLKLERRFNSFVSVDADEEPTLARKIYHYAGHWLGLDVADDFNRLWLKYFVRTPWFDEETLGRLCEFVKNFDATQKNLAREILAALAGKSRVLVSFAEDADALKEIFSMRPDEEIILVDRFNDLRGLVDAIKIFRGQKVFIITVPNIKPLLDALTREGLVAGRDFFDGEKFLSEAHGIKFKSYPLIQAL